MTQQLRVLSLDGGGMRGVYSAEYLAALSDAFAKKRNVAELDLGGAFDLVVGTSTGAILACGIAAGDAGAAGIVGGVCACPAATAWRGAVSRIPRRQTKK